MALLSVLLMKAIVKSTERSYLIMEMPTYRMPKWSNVGLTIPGKTKTSVLGKIIIDIDYPLVLASYGPKEVMEQARQVVKEQNDDLEPFRKRI